MAARYGVVFGQLLDGSPVTLLNCRGRKMSPGHQGAASDLTLVAAAAVFGTRLGEPRRPCITAIEVSLTSLEEWYGHRPIVSDALAPGGARQLTFTPMAPLALPTVDAATQLRIKTVEDGSRWTPTHSRIGWRLLLQVETTNSLNLDGAHRWLFTLRGFFWLLLGYPIYYRRIDLRIVLDPVAPRPTWCRYLSPDELPSSRRAFRSHGSISYHDIPDQLQAAWRNWLDRLDQYAVPVGLVMASDTDASLEHRFLSVCHALEALHRKRWPGRYLPNEEYARLYEGLVAEIPPNTEASLRAALKARLKYGNEYSLRKRLTELSRRLDPGGIAAQVHPQLGEFIERAVDTRNALVHREGNAGTVVFEGQALSAATLILRWFFVAVCLHDIGIPAEVVRRALDNEPELRYAARATNDG